MSRRAALEFVHQANEFARSLDRRLFAPKTGNQAGPVFIVGAPRSGTTLLYQVLAHSMRVTYLPRLLDHAYGASHLTLRLLSTSRRQPAPDFSSRYGAIAGRFSPSEAFGFWRRWFWKGPQGDHFHPNPLSAEAATELRNWVYGITGAGGFPLLVKCLYLSLAVPALSAALPQSRFVFINRDPLQVAVSLLRGPMSRNGWWSVRPPGYRERLYDPDPERIMWQVATTTCLIRESLDKLSADRWRMVSYEQLCDRPHETVAEIRPCLADASIEPWPDNEVPDCFPRRTILPDEPLLQRLSASPHLHVARAAIA